MLRIMTTLMQRCRVAGLAAAVLLAGTAAEVRAEEEPAPPSQTQPPPSRITTKQVGSTEAGATVPSEPAPPGGSPTPMPPLPSAAPSGEPTVPNAAPPAEATAPNPAAASSEPPAPSEYDYAADTDPAALQDFRDTLSPYGTWEDDGTYGVVWVPSGVVVGADFAPYVSHGHWGLGAGNAWMWVSDFSWGWAPFHYGRWIWIGGRGWAWIPGRVYAPAWVVWRTGFYDDYYIGWAPMPPSWYWRRGWAYRLGFYPPAPYVFCSASYVFAPHVRMHIAPPGRVSLIAPRTRPYVAASPSVASSGSTHYTMTRGPSMVDAHVPTGSVPAERVAPDARAMSFERSRPSSRSFAAPQAGAFTGRGDVMPRPSTFPSTPGSSVYTTRPLPPTGASMSGPQLYTPRPMTPPSGPMQPVMPAVPRPAPVSPAPMMRPSSPAPVVRPAAPPSVHMSRPSVVAPRSVAPAVRAPVTPRVSR